MKIVITGGTLEAEFKDNPLDNIRKQLSFIVQKNKDDAERLSIKIDNVSKSKDDKLASSNAYILSKIDSLKGSEQEISSLKDFITDALAGKDAKINSLSKEIKSRNTAVKEIEADTESLWNYIDQISREKDDKINALYKDLDDNEFLDESELAGIKSSIKELSDRVNDIPDNSSDVESLKGNIASLTQAHKSSIANLQAKMEKLIQSKSERIRQLRTEIQRLSNDSANRITVIKERISKVRKPSAKTPSEALEGLKPKVSGSGSGNKFMGHLNQKQKMPI